MLVVIIEIDGGLSETHISPLSAMQHAYRTSHVCKIENPSYKLNKCSECAQIDAHCSPLCFRKFAKSPWAKLYYYYIVIVIAILLCKQQE